MNPMHPVLKTAGLPSVRPALGLVVLVACFFGIGLPAAFAEQDYSFTEVVLVDDAGREVRLPRPARRVVSLSPHITESLYAVEAGDRLVGTAAWSDYPEAASRLPVIASAQYINYEAIVALQPDLVITWLTGMGEALIERLDSLGIPVYVTEPRTLPDIARSLRHFGELVGTREAGDRAAERFEAGLQRLSRRYSQRSVVTVFYQIWHEPMMTLNGRHLVSSVMALCGGSNVFAQALPLVPQVSVESVVLASPQVIVASAPDGIRPEWLDNWRRWPAIAAVRNNQLYSMDADLLERHTPRILEGAEKLCEMLEIARQARDLDPLP